ncbi:MAG TPA: glycosyltransferase, partial [Acidimicrobiales bacterium]
MDPHAPPVVAVVVTCDPGPWLEEALAALAAQDYPNLSVLVVDAGSADDPTRRVAAILPGAFVRRLGANPGYGPASNEALTVVEGASHYLFCHDDAAPDPDAVRVMVEEAFRSNAGVVSPKYVTWDDPRRLVQVGLAADKSGAPAVLVERGELDQEQHDGVTDVFWAPGGFTLVRADLFAVLRGFDPAISLYGEDLDLSWRAQLAGARVVVAPAARVRHLEADASGIRVAIPASAGLAPGDRSGPERLRRRHQLRVVLKNYSFWRLLVIVPQVALLALAELVVAVANRRWSEGRALAEAWSWNGRRLGDLRRARREVRRVRTLSDRELRRLQVRGSARLRAFVRSQVSEGGYRDRRAARVAARGSLRQILTVWAVVIFVVGVGSRQLLSRLPAIGELQPLPPAGELFTRYLSGWRPTGLGSAAPAPVALALLGLGGAALGGAVGLLRTMLVLAALPAGAVGAYRLGRALPGLRAPLVLLVAFLAVPLPYDDLARGRVQGLVAWAAAPWVLGALVRAGGLASAEAGGRGGTHRRSLARASITLGVALAAVASVSPALVLATPALGLGLWSGGLMAGRAGSRPGSGPDRPVRLLGVAIGGAAVAVGLLFPWSLDFARPGSQVAALTGVAPAAA